MRPQAEVPTVFLRKATGLVRQIGLFTAIIITLTYTIGLGWQKRVFQFSGKAVTPENQYLLGINPTVMAFIVIGFIVLLAVYTFGIVTAAMPRSGGGYVVISRVLHPYLGYTATWFWYMATAVSYGLIGTAVIEVPLLVFPQLFGSPGVPTDPAGAETLFFVAGTAVVIVFGVIALFGVRLTGLLLQVMFIIPAALTVIVYYLMASANATSLSTGLNTLWGVTPTAVTNSAIAQGMDTNHVGYAAAFGTGTLGAYWAYEGYAATTFVAGEVKEANRNLPRSLFIAGAVIVIVYVSASSLLFRATSLVGGVDVGGNHYSLFSSWAYLAYSGGKTLPGTLPPAWMPLVAYAQANGVGLGSLGAVLGVFSIFWVMNDIPPFILTASRALFAMSFDRTLPAKFSDVSERWHSPSFAILFTMIIGVFGALSEAEGDYGVISGSGIPGMNGIGHILSLGVPSTDLWDLAFFAIFSLAAALLPFIRKDIYETSPYKPRIGALPIITLTGILSMFGHLYIIWWELTLPSGYGINPNLYSSSDIFTDLLPTLFTIGLLIVFTLLYVGYTTRGKAKGTDFRTIYTEIPPE